MERILEPEYMDTVEEATEYEAMDHTSANGAVVDDVLAAGGRGRALDLGTGPGDIPLLLVERSSSIEHVTAVDAAETMLVLARHKIAVAGCGDRVEAVRADVKDLPFDDGRFDLVFSNTILHHIPEPVAMLREAWRVVAPGGLLWIRDLYRPATEDVARDLVAQYVGDGTARQQQLFFDSLHAALTVDEARATARDAGIPNAHVAMNSDRHYTLVARRDPA